MSTKRFASHSEEEILNKRSKVIPNNTKKGNNSAASLLRDYLHEKGQNINFEQFDCLQLCEVLGHFYIDLRTHDGDLYKVSTLESIRHGLNRYLKAPPHLKKYDIIKDSIFTDANECFKTAQRESKIAGKGEVQHKEAISDGDREKIYQSLHMNPNTPCGLANKVQFDIRLYFFRRGAENMEDMKKGTFKIMTDPDTGLRYVKQAQGELSKNHRDDKDEFGACMPEIHDYEYCPVKSFERYLSKLNPQNDKPWQYPRVQFHPDDDVWYANKPIGRNTLSKFMSNLSESCGLSTRYTNHCIRVTGATILTRSNFASSQIMSVTGHKSVSSLSVYQRTSTKEKIDMGRAIARSLSTSDVPAILPTPQPQRQAQGNQFELDCLDAMNIDQLMCDFNDIPSGINRVNGPLFENCTIGTINIIEFSVIMDVCTS